MGAARAVLFLILFSGVVVCVPEVSVGTDPRAPDHFTVEFIPSFSPSTPIVMNVTRAWAPLGVDHFYALLNDKFYDMAAFFRVVPQFVVQFGIAGVPAENNKWSTPIKDDPVVASGNLVGLVSRDIACRAAHVSLQVGPYFLELRDGARPVSGESKIGSRTGHPDHGDSKAPGGLCGCGGNWTSIWRLFPLTVPNTPTSTTGWCCDR